MGSLALILAITKDSGGYGYKGRIPWSYASDRSWFRKITTDHVVIMGRKTWDSLGRCNKQPLENRINVVISKSLLSDNNNNFLVFKSLSEALFNLKDHKKKFIIGGASLWEDCLFRDDCKEIYLTEIQEEYKCDVFWEPDLDQFDLDFEKNSSDNELIFKRYIRKPVHGEQQYLDAIYKTIRTGISKMDRTNVGTISLFGNDVHFSFDLKKGGFPLLTTKKVFWRGVIEELLWFISGSTNCTELSREKNVHIWDGNSTREFLDSRGLKDYPEGELGPVYGYQWRHFGKPYTMDKMPEIIMDKMPNGRNSAIDPDDSTVNTDGGVDQLAWCIHEIKTNPSSRRILMSSWNPVDIPKMALPPCHVLCQFSVSQNHLSCHLYQRSADLGLGVPFNIASYALLTHLVAHVCELNVGKLDISFGDIHVYQNHVDILLEQQLPRKPFPFPKLQLTQSIKNIDDFRVEHIKLIDYYHHPEVKLPLAI